MVGPRTLALLVIPLVGCGQDGYLIESKPSDAGVEPDAPADVVGEEAAPAPLCGDGLTCEDPGSGMLACLEDGALPPGTTYGCELGACPPNFRCRYTDATQTETACFQNCGTCPPPTSCVKVTETGQLGCLENGEIPAGAVYGCVPTAGCNGNATCYLLDDEGSSSACVQNCSPCQAGSCPDGQTCVDGVCESG
jgi:hypothetical protein